ncbi:MAG TPA: FecR domain-containing protein [Chthoniobacteraceae bacterium]|jgi:hypothetical protein|nr:FecR domain-containing protein [Chthoniobacteraceae bacterium]
MRHFTNFRSTGHGLVRFLVLGAAAQALALSGYAAPFASATVTKVEHKVFLGERQAERSAKRPAVENDVLRAQNFLLSESDSRAEIQYPDGTVVRIGQNSVFSFNSASRELVLDKGSLLFHIPKGAGGGTIKTASLTAAITGTAGKISDNYIVIVEGEVKLIPSGRIVHKNEFARRNADGSITIAPIDQATILAGVLVEFNGHMPGFPERALVPVGSTPVPFVGVRDLEVLTRTTNLPGSVNHFFPFPKPDKPKPKEEEVVKPKETVATPRPVPVSPTRGPKPIREL